MDRFLISCENKLLIASERKVECDTLPTATRHNISEEGASLLSSDRNRGVTKRLES